MPVGTHAKVRARDGADREAPFDVVSNPEFMKEGAAIDDFMKPDRVVIGAARPEAFEIMRELYEPFVPHRRARSSRWTTRAPR